MDPIKLVILGAGGNCRDIIDIALDINRDGNGPTYEPLGYLDDDPAKRGLELGGYPVLGPIAQAAEMADCHFVNGINGTALMPAKAEIVARTGVAEGRFATLVHPAATVSQMARTGAGCVIFPNATVSAGVTIGNHVIILPNAVAAHDVSIADHCYITAGVSLAGYVTIAEAAYLGTNSAVMCRKTVGKEAIVGMGAVVLADVAPRAVVAGNPARVLRFR